MKQVDNLVFDVSGLLYRTYFASKNVPQRSTKSVASMLEDDDDRQDDSAGFALHTALVSMLKFFKKYKPSRVVACFDRPDNWRKLYMQSDVACSPLQYKGQRRQNMSSAQKADYFKFLEHAQEFEQLLEKETGIVTLAGKMLEADDCIAGWVQMHAHETNIICSNDSDMQQLITENTRVCNLTSGDLVDCADPKFFLFEKTFRGDTADNIISAYPRIRTAKLQKAYEDPYTLANILGEPCVVPGREGVELTVRDVWEENNLLMDLTKQPAPIRSLIEKTIKTELQQTKRFDFWKFSAFCNKHKLKNISSNLPTYRPLLVGGYKNVRS